MDAGWECVDSHRALRGSIRQGLWSGLCLQLSQAEVEGLASNPRGRAKALGQRQLWTTASSGRALVTPTANKAVYAARRPRPLLGPCLR